MRASTIGMSGIPSRESGSTVPRTRRRPRSGLLAIVLLGGPVAEPVGVHRSRPFSSVVGPAGPTRGDGLCHAPNGCGRELAMEIGRPEVGRAVLQPVFALGRCAKECEGEHLDGVPDEDGRALWAAYADAPRLVESLPGPVPVPGDQGDEREDRGRERCGEGLPLDTGETERDRRAPPLAVREVGESLGTRRRHRRRNRRSLRSVGR